MQKQQILEAYHFRHACKAYDRTKKINDQDMRFILETGRLSPSSFGFEPWRFIVIENQSLRELIRDNAWGAKDKVMDCSHFVLILVRQQSSLHADSSYIHHMLYDVHKIPAEAAEMRREFYRQYSTQDAEFANDKRAFYDWACKQSYIALGNMLTTAAMLGIDSTPIEGFPYCKLNQLLAEQGLYDLNEFKLSVMAAFGYRLQPGREKTRQNFDDVVRWIK